MAPASKKYTGFSVLGTGLYHFQFMSFGLTNALATFCRLVDALFGPEFEPKVFAYLHDIIIVSDTCEEHLKWLKLDRLVTAGLKVNREKCEFCCSSVIYLGFLLDAEGLRPDPEKTEAVTEYPALTNNKELRKFLGIMGWYSCFIEHESEYKATLSKLLHKIQKWEWGEEQQKAFEALKLALCSAPVLARPDFSRPFEIQCDASEVALEAVLTQKNEAGEEHPILYLSRTLNKHKLNYRVSEKELLAVVWSIEKLRPYIEGYHFTVVTDHSALMWLKKLKDPTGRLARWAIELQQWDFEIVHRKGSQYQFPDASSRIHDGGIVKAFEEIRDPGYLGLAQVIEKWARKYAGWQVEKECIYKHRTNVLLDPMDPDAFGWKLVVFEEHKERVL